MVAPGVLDQAADLSDARSSRISAATGSDPEMVVIITFKSPFIISYQGITCEIMKFYCGITNCQIVKRTSQQ